MSDHYVTAREVAELLGISAATVLDWVEADKLPGFRIGGTKGGRLRFRMNEIEALVESWRIGPAPGPSRLEVL